MINGYLNKTHSDIADFVFKALKDGERNYHGHEVIKYSGHDVRHVIQAYGWVQADLQNEIQKLHKRIKELENQK